MEISEGIITKGILKMEEHYGEIKDLFGSQSVPGCLSIKEKLKNFNNSEIFKIPKKYPDLTSKYKELKDYSDKTIYMFSVKKFSYDKSKTKAKFEDVKSSKERKISLCRINEGGWEKLQENEPVCLYVGSSEKIHQRLKEHLFLCNPTAYAMHLAEWFPEDLLITIDTWDFGKFLEGKNHEFLQSIEDLLWAHYKPLFGRQGKK